MYFDYKINIYAIKLFAVLSIAYSCHHTHVMNTQPIHSGSEMLYQYKWNLAELNGEPVTTDNINNAHMLFYPGKVNSVSGSTGCNRLTGTIELSGVNKIKFSPLATTKMACPGQNESQLLMALAQVNKWSIINSQLLLNNGNILVAKLQGVAVGQPK
jgi:heat shock protein HslJ